MHLFSEQSFVDLFMQSYTVFFKKNNTQEQENLEFSNRKLNYTLTVFTIKVISISLLAVTVTIEM